MNDISPRTEKNGTAGRPGGRADGDQVGLTAGMLVRAAIVLLLLLVAVALWPGVPRAQLTADPTISTQGTQFIGPERTPPPPPPPQPRQPAPPRAAIPQPPPTPEPPQVQQPAGPPPRYPSVVFLLDTSDSMLNTVPGGQGTRLDDAKAALTQVVRGMSQETRVQLWTFNTRLKPLALRGGQAGTFIPIGGKGLKERLIEKIKGIRTAGGTNLYQAIIRTLDIFAAPADQPLYRSGQRFPVLVIISDGEDGGKTGHTLDAVLAAKRRFPLVTINAIGFHLSGEDKSFRDLCRITTRPEGCTRAGNREQLQAILESFYRPLGGRG